MNEMCDCVEQILSNWGGCRHLFNIYTNTRTHNYKEPVCKAVEKL